MIEKHLLTNNWVCKRDPKEIGIIEQYYDPNQDFESWDGIRVPGHWQDELPKLKDYNGTVWYRTDFNLPESFKDRINSRTRLIFRGVFYYCDVFLNGIALGNHEGYFDEFGYDVTSLLEFDAPNVLVVRVSCMDEPDINTKKQIIGTFGHWDASDPNFNPGGIWNDVLLYKTGTAYFDRVRITTDLIDEDFAVEKFEFEIASSREQHAQVRVKLSPANFEGTDYEITKEVHLLSGLNEFFLNIDMKDPKLWWTWDIGDQNLYDVDIDIKITDHVSDDYKTRTGIKEFKNDRVWHGPIKGENWAFYLNKKRFFPKGTNVPPEQHLARGSLAKFKNDFQMLKDANMNMIRVHAHVSRDELHQACDELGILVWQDLPLQWFYSKKKFRQAKQTARRAARKLQHHPSQAIWCCHNEPFKFPNAKEILKFIVAIFIAIELTSLLRRFLLGPILGGLPGIIKELVYIVIGILIYLPMGLKWDLLFPEMFAYNSNKSKLDPALADIIRQEEGSQNVVVPYSGICKGGVFPMYSFYAYTDIHAYPGWYGSFFRGYRALKSLLGKKKRKHARFVTEYGSQSLPSKELMHSILDPGERWPMNWKKLSRDHRAQPMFCKWWYPPKMAENLDDYIKLTQEYQAEQIHMQTEVFRQIKHDNLEGLITFLGFDCFPAVTWSIIDYNRKPKKAYAIVKKAFEPLYAFLKSWPDKKYKPGDTFESDVLLSNDYWERKEKVTVQWNAAMSDGTVFQRGDFTASIGPDNVKEIGKISFSIPTPVEYDEKERDSIKLTISVLNPQSKMKVVNNEYRLDINKYKWPH